MPTYARGTDVGVNQSRDEIEKTLRRYSASSFAYGWDGGSAVIQFRIGSRNIRIRIPIPPIHEFATTPAGKKRTLEAQESAHDQAIRQRWRALSLVIKAKLEAVESGISTTEAEFLAFTVLADGRTVEETIAPQIEAAIAGVSPLLIGA